MEQTSRIHFDVVSHDVEATKSAQHPLEKSSTSASLEKRSIGPIAVDERDVKRKQVYHGWALGWLAYQSIGVIYGDIGTSPLYVYSSTFESPPSYDDLVGALSLIIWTLIIVVSVKYIFIVLCADDEGEGGTFALYTLMSRYSNIMSRDPRTEPLVRLERYMSSDMRRSNLKARSFIEKNRFLHTVLKVLAVLGVSLIMADGVLTPAQSVLGAIQGLEIVKPDISTGTIIGVSCAIIILLFFVQPFGVERLSFVFAPIVSIWMLFNLSFGIYNLVKHDHSVLKAFSPYFAGHYFIHDPTKKWKSLGGILLAFTGVEALFADLGAFSKRAVQLSWLCFCFPCLLLAYIGQAAYISDHREAYTNPFFNSAPPGTFYPALVISILAAIVASQALITSTFQLLSQVMTLSYFPQVTLEHTSDRFHGQVYIPFANWLMLVGTVIVTAVYHNTTRLGHAYGVCVILVTFITTNMVALVAIIVWRINPLLVLLIWLPFACFDGLYLSSVLTKVPDGAWFTLLLALIISSVFILWRYGKEQQWLSESKEKIQTRDLVVKGPNGLARLGSAFGGTELAKFKGLGIFFDKRGFMVPTVYTQFIHKFEAQHEVQVLLHLRALAVPHVPEEERYSVTRTSIDNCYRLIIRHGYADYVVDSQLSYVVYNELKRFLVHDTVAMHDRESAKKNPPGLEPSEVDAMVAAEIETLERAYQTHCVYLVGKEHLKVLEGTNKAKRLILEIFLWIRENTATKVASMKIPIDQLVEVGFIKELK
ncbi:MAG: hypothetical protein M1819_002440 [Sarea resinae]|nr:MAG: hypothetical protein M1819_002440 [Sarea resinae]